MRLRNPLTGKNAVKIRVWFTSHGSGPLNPEFVRRRYEERYVAVPDDCLGPYREPWSITSEHGETADPIP